MLVFPILILWLIAEVAVAIEVAQLIGVLVTVLLLIVAMPLGARLMRAEGRTAWRRLSAAVAAGRPPGREVADAALVLIGGVLLIVPGFIGDLVGLLLLAPPIRSVARRGVQRNVRNRIFVQATQFTRPAEPYDVDSTASDIDPRTLPR
ncbi:MAG TPA: FxsA family protein [Solirubrobacteraceae bacterium]|jgi:UPF0716 protein FxsA